jgi:hypothetical protein
LRILALGSELLQNFKKIHFQKELTKLLAQADENSFVLARMELALTVQCAVLPKHGLPGSSEGVLCMLDVLAPFLTDPEVHEMINDLDEVLGLPRNWTVDALIGARTKGGVSLTHAQVLMLSTELLGAFNAAEFQERLGALCNPGAHSIFVTARADLAMTVQSKVLPKYGIPGNLDGVLIMLDALAPYGSDYTVISVLNAIDKALGQAAGTTLSSLPPFRAHHNHD